MNNLSGKTALVTGAGQCRGPRGVVDTDISNFTKTEAGREITLGSKRCPPSRG